MATIIDDLFLRFKYAVVGDATNQMKKTGDAVRGLISGIGRLAGVSATLYGVGAAISSVVDKAFGLGNIAQATGENVEELAVWQKALESVGASSEQFMGTVQGMSQKIQELMHTGGGDLAIYMGQLGISLQKSNGDIKTATELMNELSGAWESFSDSDQKFIGNLLGIDDSTIRFLGKGNEEVNKLLDSQRKLNVINQENVALSGKIRTGYYQLRSIWSNAAEALTARLLPAVDKAIDFLLRMSTVVLENEPLYFGLLTGIASLITLVVIPALYALAAAWIAPLAPVLLVVGALSVLSAALWILYDDYIAFKNGGGNAFTEVWVQFDRMSTEIQRIGRQVGDFLKKLWNDPKQAWDDTVAYFENRWKGMTLKQIGQDIITSFWGGISGAWENYIVPFLLSIDQQFVKYLGFSLIEEANAIIQSFIDGITNMATAVDNAITNSVFGPIYTILKDMAGMAYEFTSKMMSAILGSILQKVDNVLAAFDIGILDGIAQLFIEFNPFLLMIQALEKIVSVIRSMSGRIWEAMRGLLSYLWTLWQGFHPIELIKAAFNAVRDYITNFDISTAMGGFFKRLSGAATKAYEDAKQSLKNTANDFLGIFGLGSDEIPETLPVPQPSQSEVQGVYRAPERDAVMVGGVSEQSSPAPVNPYATPIRTGTMSFTPEGMQLNGGAALGQVLGMQNENPVQPMVNENNQKYVDVKNTSTVGAIHVHVQGKTDASAKEIATATKSEFEKMEDMPWTYETSNF